MLRNRWMLVLIAVGIPAGLAGCSKNAPRQASVVAERLHKSYDRFAVDALQARMRRIRPMVEKVLGQRMSGSIAVVPLSRREYVGLKIRAASKASVLRQSEIEQLKAVEEARASSVLGEYSREEGIMVFPENLLAYEEDSRGAVVDVVLAHELVHAYQDRVMGLRAPQNAQAEERVVWQALIEGHAEYVARRVATALGAGTALDLIAASRDPVPFVLQQHTETDRAVAVATLPMVAFSYGHGGRFFASVAEELGEEAAIEKIFRAPPRTLLEVTDADEYLKPPGKKLKADNLIGRLLRTHGDLGRRANALPSPFVHLQLVHAGLESADAAMRGVRRATALTFDIQSGALRGHKASALLVRTASPDAAGDFIACLRRALSARPAWVSLGKSVWTVDSLRLSDMETDVPLAFSCAMWLRGFFERKGRNVQYCALRRGDLVLQLLVQAPPDEALFVTRLGWRMLRADDSRPEDIATLLDDPDPQERVRALSILTRSGLVDRVSSKKIASLLHDVDPEVRAATVEMLTGTSARVVPLLVVASVHQDPKVRVRALRLLAIHPEYADRMVLLLSKAFADTVADVRRTGVEIASKQGLLTVKSIEQVKRLLADPIARVRAEAAIAIGRTSKLSPDERMRLLRPLSRDAAVLVRQAVWISLHKLSIRVEVPAEDLYRALEDENEGVRWSAVDCLKFHVRDPDAELLARISKSLRDPSPTVRSRVSLLLIPPGEQARPLLRQLVAALDDSATRHGALSALRELRAREALPAFYRLLDDPAFHIDAAMAIIELGTDEVVPVLRALVRDWDPLIRCLAVRQLHALGKTPADAVALLVSVLQDAADGAARACAAAALGSLEAKPAVPMLAKALHDEDKKVRAEAIAALTRIPPVSREIVVAVAERLNDPARCVRTRVLSALKNLGTIGAPALPMLLSALEHESEVEFVRACCDVVVAIGSDERDVNRVLSRLLASTNEDIRQIAQETIERLEERRE